MENKVMEKELSRFLLMDRETEFNLESYGQSITLGLPGAGASVMFDGWVRNNHLGRRVLGLEYSAYKTMAVQEGQAIVLEAITKFDLLDARCIHWLGTLAIGDRAVWIGVWSGHRQAAFEACRFIIDRIKDQVPIWKKEQYQEGDYDWVANLKG